MVIKIGKESIEVQDRKAHAAALEFVEVKEEIDALNAKLKTLKETLAHAAEAILDGSDTQTLTYMVEEDVGVKVAFGWDIKIADKEALEEKLGDRFADLVSVKVEYRPQPKLKEMALEDDAVASCFAIKPKAPAVSVVK